MKRLSAFALLCACGSSRTLGPPEPPPLIEQAAGEAGCTLVGGVPVCAATASSGVMTLVRVQIIAAADNACGAVARRVSTGLDNGENGGIANNGVLEAGEVDSERDVCAGALYQVDNYREAPAGAPGTRSIRADGGNATGATGGAGGAVALQLLEGSRVGAVRVFNTGSVDASWQFPENVAYDLGRDPLDITADTVFENIAGLSYAGDNVFIDGKLVTGLRVRAGATLTFHLSHTLAFPRDVVVAGSIVGNDPTSRHAPSLELTCATFVGLPGARVTLDGDASDAGATGGNGGQLSISARIDINTSQAANGSVFNQATIDSRGGDGQTGGDGGSIYLSSGVTIYNTGAVSSRGGRGLVGRGGSGGDVQVISEYGSAYNAGALTSRGGDGATAGGDADAVELAAYYTGHVFNTAAMHSDGGSVDAACAPTDPVTCAGGNGFGSYVWTWGGDIYAAGEMVARGGASARGRGGDGGEVEVGNYTASTWFGDAQSVAGTTYFSADVDTRGGDGAAGGNGGPVTLEGDIGEAPLAQELHLYGIATISAVGGLGVVEGGGGGDIKLLSSPSRPYVSNAALQPAGAVVVYANVTSDGGPSSSGAGGDAGAIRVNDFTLLASQQGVASVELRGALSANGGAGGASGGDAGFVLVQASDDITVANVSAVAGDGPIPGGDDDGVWIYSLQGNVSVTGDVITYGGSGATGSQAGELSIEGEQVTITGVLRAHGGNGSSGPGGDGNAISVFSRRGVSSVGSITADGGTGTPPGRSVRAFIDGF